jgi:hypothetical protein
VAVMLSSQIGMFPAAYFYVRSGQTLDIHKKWEVHYRGLPAT